MNPDPKLSLVQNWKRLPPMVRWIHRFDALMFPPVVVAIFVLPTILVPMPTWFAYCCLPPLLAWTDAKYLCISGRSPVPHMYALLPICGALILSSPLLIYPGAIWAVSGLLSWLWGLATLRDHDVQPTRVAAPPPPPTTFGSARWGTLDYMLEHRLIGDDGLMVGVVPGAHAPLRIRYTGDRHLLTIAPNGSGKGTTAIIPNLLTHDASCVVIDPKGENAMITAAARTRMGHAVHVVDPWGIASEAGPAARFNPLDGLIPGDLDMADKAMMLADSLVVADEKGESFWNQEAKALLQGLIVHVATDEEEAGRRHLGRVRDLLLLDDEDMTALFERMMLSPHRAVSGTGARGLQKDPKTLANVLSSTQAQTDFPDSPRLRESLSASDFDFADLKRKPMTVYLVLPADRLDAFGRWLRLLIQQALTNCARDIAHRPDKPVLFLLDEMAALGRLSMVQQAFGLMRGFGIQLWAIVQNAGQLEQIYGKSWEGFVANAGAIMYHGSRDHFTADYFSKLCGVATVLNFSHGTSESSAYGKDGRTVTMGASATISHVQRKLAFPDELMRLEGHLQLVLIDHHRPIVSEKLPWFQDAQLAPLGRNLHLKLSPDAQRLDRFLSDYRRARA